MAFDGSSFSDGSLKFLKELNSVNPLFISGAFLPQTDVANLWSYASAGMQGGSFVPLVEAADSQTINKNISRFVSFCKTNRISHSIHKEYFDFALPELKRESRFADLIVVSSEKFYENAGTEVPNEYLTNLLHGIECPALVLNEHSTFPKSNILAYDGSESSVFAIKQFAYLFPEFSRNKTTLLNVHRNANHLFPDEPNIRELAGLHFPHLKVNKLEFEPKKFLSTWMDEVPAPILVSGAFSRSEVSMIFHKSFVNEIIADQNVPVFIAHR